MAYFYRRPNGVYYARIRVPDALRAVFGAPDLRRSLHTTDHALASRLALAAAFEWKSEFQRLRMFDATKLLTGSPLLHTAGLISLGDAAQLIGLDVVELFLAAKTRRLMFCLMADGWMGADVPRAELISADPSVKTLNLDVGETLDGRELRPVLGVVYIRPNALAFVGEDGMFNDCLFFRDAARRHAVVMNMPGLTVPVNVLMLPRTDIEVLRQVLAAKVLPTMLNQSISTSSAPTTLHSDQITAAVERGLMGEAYKHKEEPISVMLGAYYADKGARWATATLDQNKRMCAVFVDLMGDPVLGLIDRELVKSYRSKLLGVPLALHRVKSMHPGVGMAGLIEVAAAEGLPVMDELRADRHIAKIGEAFAWAARNGYIKDNPAAHLATGARTVRRKQDNRQMFGPAALALIFGQPWFRYGRGELTKQGRYHTFQPFNYWMPLLGLFTGARLNELAQLYLKDVAVSEHGQWYLDFNLDGDGKIDADSADQNGDTSAGDKQLKTINSVRIVAMHPELVRLGLPDYVERLRDAGHSRLFPELKRDEIKGYGKYAGQWFNERFLGKKLGLPRDGTQTFHSFRHTFLTKCDRVGMPDRVRDELAGHSRGKGEGHATYIKDRSADEQATHLNPLRFDLPVIAPFDVSEGLRVLMNDQQMVDMLRGVWETIATGGLNKIEPGAALGRGMEANAHAESRVLHFNSADDFLAYQQDFGEASLYEVLTGHIRSMADSIALVETLGPNPEHAYRLFRDTAQREAVMADPNRRGKVAKELVSLDNIFNSISGKTLPVADERLARGFDSLRKWLVASRLGSVPISSLPDEATMRMTAHVNNLDQMQLLRAQLATLNPANADEKRLAQRAGLGLQTMIGALNRFGDESMRNTLASKLATFQMRVSGNNAITEARRRAFGTTMMSSLGHLVRDLEAPAKLDPLDHRILLSKGLTEADWQVWRLAELEDWGMPAAEAMLTPEAIRRIPDEKLAGIGGPEATPEQLRADASTRLLGIVLEETNMAIVEPGTRERAALYSNLQRGTWKGELARSVFLFKTMPIAMVLRHWERGMAGPDARSRAGYLAALVASTTVLGMAAVQVDEMLKGRDPVNMNPFEGKAGARNWIRAMLKGGSLGLYGDFLMSEQTQHGQSPTAAMLGPVIGLGEEAFGLTQGNLVQVLQGKDTHAGAELLKFARGMTPLANNWYTKAVTDHLIFNQLQEMVSAGYLARVRSRAQREFGQSFYWEPQDTAPSRLPDFAAAAGD